MAKEKDEVSYVERVQIAKRYWTEHGDPLKARDIQRALDAGEDIDPALLNLTNIRPRAGVDVAEVGEVPPRTGKGSGLDRWKEFAKATSTLDPDVIESLSKEDLIETLEAGGVIPMEE